MGSAVTVKITDWISLEYLLVGWEFNFDSLTVYFVGLFITGFKRSLKQKLSSLC
jgi:hypothetical protein